MVTSYLLANTITVAVVGRFGDLLGRKLVFQVSTVVFVVGSAFSGAAQSMEWLIVARAVQGLGAGGITVTATALIGDVIPLRERGKYQGGLGAVFGVTTVIGPLLGGYVTDHVTWRWAFYVNLPIAAIVVVMSAITIPSVRPTARPVIDWAGVALIALGAGGLTLATSWGGTTYGWGSPEIIGLVALSLVAFATFVLVEQRAEQPILPPRLFGSRLFSVCCALAFVVGFAMLGSITFLPTLLQYVDGVSATASGVRMLPLVFGLLVTSVGAGTIVGKTDRAAARCTAWEPWCRSAGGEDAGDVARPSAGADRADRPRLRRIARQGLPVVGARGYPRIPPRADSKGGAATWQRQGERSRSRRWLRNADAGELRALPGARDQRDHNLARTRTCAEDPRVIGHGAVDRNSWGVIEVTRFARARGDAHIDEIARWHRLPASVLDPTFDRLADGGMIRRENGVLTLTAAGETEVSRLTGALRAWLRQQLADWEQEADEEQIGRALDRIARRMLGDEADSERTLVSAGSIG